jgi:NADPH-dependent glutamate synthase beta subunit-like oxidoreductase
MLRKCIPDSRLPKQVLAKEIQYLKELGANFKTSTTIGKDMDFEELMGKGYKAIFIGVGAHKSAKLRIDGADMTGVHHALDFLWKVNSGEKVTTGKNVVVIGGGNVAMDAARAALRLGAGAVTILYRRSREEMPAIPWEIKEAEDEGVKIQYLVSPKRIVGENSKVSAIECVRTQLGEPDDSGRRAPVTVEGSDFSLKTDMVILAVGESPDLGFLPHEAETSGDGTLCVNPVSFETNIRGVFAGGDVVTGPATVIEAIRAGMNAAVSIESYLKSLEG